MAATNKIGAKICQLREAKKMSVEELAEKSQSHVDQIRQIEAGDLVLSLAPMLEISQALGVPLDTLLGDEPVEGPVVFKSDQAPNIIRFLGQDTKATSSNLDFYSMGAGKIDRHMEPFIIDVKPRAGDTPPLSAHEGEEFIFVLTGSIEISYGKTIYQLEPGESIYYDSNTPHDVYAKGDRKARILAVIYAPS